jgi:amino acid permease
MKSKNKTQIIICAIVCIAFIEAIALSNGIDGIVLSTVIATITGLVGLIIKTPKILSIK